MNNSESTMKSTRLAGRVALVTGASRGIGAATAERLADEGATVAVNYWKSEREAREVVQRIEARGGKSKAFKADLSDPAQNAVLVESVAAAFGALDILVNNVGGFVRAPLEAIDVAHVRSLMLGNVYGPIFTTQTAVKYLARTGGRVINVSAIASHHSLPGMSVYAATKAAVNALTRTWALELAPKGITVNAVAPGPVDTDMLRSAGFDEHARGFLVSRTPLGRIGVAADVANAIAFLASVDASWITGQVIDTAGGFLP
jgi:3-oxoacyl-[acyl-carrier protein] reductase